MKGVIYTHYGLPDVLQIGEIKKPVPKENEVLVKIHATTVNRTDNATVKAIPFFARIITGFFKPKCQTSGSEFSGDVEAVGENVLSLKVGDKVFGFQDLFARAHAQYLAIKAENVISMPDGLSYEQAAAGTEGLHYALNFINKVKIEKGQSVLVYGASGAIGSAAVQLLKFNGVKVTAVCGTKNLALIKSLGADKVIDYTQEDFTKDEHKYHYVLDAVGKVSFFQTKHMLLPGGVYISSDLGFMAQNLFLPVITPILKSFLDNKKTVSPFPKDIPASLKLKKTMIEATKFTAVIDKSYPLEEIVDAFRYVEKGHKIGNVVVNVSHTDAGLS